MEGSEHTVNDSFGARVLERGEPVWQMDHVGIPIPRYLAEVERMLHLGTHSIIPRKQSALSLGGKIFSAHLLNAFGVVTVDIVRYLEGVRAGVNYSWEPAATVPPVLSTLLSTRSRPELYDLGEALQGDPSCTATSATSQ